MASNAEAVAIYWDFENLHAGLCDQKYGQGTYFLQRFKPQEELVDVSAIVEFALSVGPIAVNRAFANWLSFNRYRIALLHSAVELIQVFPPGANAKNGADIKLCLDVMDDMARFAHIRTFIVVGGDSDYMPLSYKVKAAGRTLIGIGSRPSTNQHWARSCHEFKFYETLVNPVPLPAEEKAPPVPQAEAEAASPAAAPSDAAATAAATASPTDPAAATSADEPAASPATGQPAEGPPPADADELRALLDIATDAQRKQREARELMVKAIGRLAQARGESWVQKARLRPFLQRIDSTFHESNYGYESFNEMLASMGDLIQVRRGESDHELRLIQTEQPVGP